jgi:hypothetical protein
MKVDAVKKRLEQVVDEAMLRIDLDSAKNPELRKAIHIVEVFLMKKGRICYGGQAINAQLPQSQQFYDPNVALPDYDFFSPNAESDTSELIEELKMNGFNEISKRIGIHDGTIKVYVNYVAIADISQMIPEFYDSIYKKSIIVNGIRYADPLFLRMLMYLELSRPRGQVDRWSKVFSRLRLLDKVHPINKCKSKYPHVLQSKEAEKARPQIVRYMINNHRVFMGADIHSIYKLTGKGKSTETRKHFLLNGNTPVVFFSPNAEQDADILSKLTGSSKKEELGFQNILPAMINLFKEDSLICVIVQEEACHSTVSLPLTKGRTMKVASLDTLLTFLIGLYYRPNSLLMTQDSLLCWIRQYIDLSNRYKTRPTKLFPAFPIECSGYQTSFASLLRAKAARIQAQKQRLTSGRYSMTRVKKYVNEGSRRTRRKYT